MTAGSRLPTRDDAASILDSLPVGLLLVCGAFISLLVLVPFALHVENGMWVPILAAGVTTPLLVAWIFQPVKRRKRRSPLWRPGLLLRVLPPLLFVALYTGEAFWMASQDSPANNEARCVDAQTLIVVPSQECGFSGSLNMTPDYPGNEWYYGGTGTQVGDQAQGGSFNPPGYDGGGNGGVGNGTDGGDDGGDGGGGE